MLTFVNMSEYIVVDSLHRGFVTWGFSSDTYRNIKRIGLSYLKRFRSACKRHFRLAWYSRNPIASPTPPQLKNCWKARTQ